jgi:hypothetical protein
MGKGTAKERSCICAVAAMRNEELLESCGGQELLELESGRKG